MGKGNGWVRMLVAMMVVWGVEAQSAYTPADNFLVSCGGSANVTANDGRVFVGDNVAGNALGTAAGGVVASTSVPDANLANPKLLQQARIFTANASYTFAVTPGRHWVRMYFYPFTYTTFTPNASVFSVVANQYVLLYEFKPQSWVSTDKPSVFREYSLNITSNKLVLDFYPSGSNYAFVNAIEVVSAPDDILIDDANVVGPAAVQKPFGLESTAVQVMYHVNVGGGVVSPQNDSTGIWRTWVTDDAYLFGVATGTVGTVPVAVISYTSVLPEYIAPPTVYSSARTMGVSNTINVNINLTWIFPVDLGYRYFVRLHFCELFVSNIGQRVFNVYINNQTADSNVDVISSTGHQDWPMYRDYLVPMLTGSSKLWVQIGPAPSSASSYRDAILNGVEIFKLNNTDGSLAGANPSLLPGSDGSSGSSGSSGSRIGAIAGASVAGILAVGCITAAIWFCCCKQTKMATKRAPPAWLPLPHPGSNSETIASKMSTVSHKSGTGSYVSTAGTNLGRYFTFAELQDATNNFDESLILGVGGFGKVYKGEIDDGTKVAVKRGNPCSEQGLTEFQTEIELLSKLRHRHLVSLIGYCEEHCEMILVYDYMANGPLRGHLYGTDLPQLEWKNRLEICIGAARGLHYLHTGAAQGIIHRDVKTTNILLDENFVAKVADFGLSKTGPTLEQTHISTAVKGSFGYLDPEYFRRQQLTEKSDVYSFGVVLMEVLCARPAINPALPRDQVNIAEWALQKQKQGLLETIMDPKLVGACNPESLRKFGETAEKCLQEQGVDRPAMGDVLWNLEYALQLQENSGSTQPNLMDASAPMVSLMPSAMTSHPLDDSSQVSGMSEAHILGSDDDDLEDASASAVFSQLVNPQGR